MTVIIYGTKTFSKRLGFVGTNRACENCGYVYQEAIVRYRTWAHLNEIPLFPVKSNYFKMCPVCGNGNVLLRKDAKELLTPGNKCETQKITYYSKHILANKPMSIWDMDQSYEFWLLNNLSGENICIKRGLTKDDVKALKKDRGAKKVQYINIQ